MLIEATDQPVRFRFRDGKETLLPLGIPIEVPDHEARRILERAAGKVRPVATTQPDWLQEWREVAEISSGLTKDDPRLPSVMAALGGCDASFAADDWLSFQEAKSGVIRAMEKGLTASDPRQQLSSNKAT